MLIDILNSSNYISVNRDAIRIFGLNTAVYCSEILTIYKKAINKKKLYDDNYFKVDRNYIEKQTSISIEEQLNCDANLLKVNIIKRDTADPDIIQFDVELFASILACEDVKIQENIAKKTATKKSPKVKGTQRERIIINLKKNILCNTPEITFGLEGWIDSIMADDKRVMSAVHVKMFKDQLDDYCNGDLPKALEILRIATVHQYIDCQWAINLFEKNNKPTPINTATTLKNVQQKKTLAVSEVTF